MLTNSESGSASTRMFWTGRVLSGLVVAFLIFDGTVKAMQLDVALKSTAELGYPESVVFGLGVLTLAIAALYAIRRTSILGAVLLTGLLGGAIATHVRVGSPIFSHILFDVFLGLLAWGGLFLRDARVRALIPFRRR